MSWGGIRKLFSRLRRPQAEGLSTLSFDRKIKVIWNEYHGHRDDQIAWTVNLHAPSSRQASGEALSTHYFECPSAVADFVTRLDAGKSGYAEVIPIRRPEMHQGSDVKASLVTTPSV